MKAKNKMKYSLLSLALVSAFSFATTPKFLSEDPNHPMVVDKDLVVNVKKEMDNRKDVVETKPESQVKKNIEMKALTDYEAYIDPEESAAKAKELSDLQHKLQVSKLIMQQEQINESINSLKSKSKKEVFKSLIEKEKEKWAEEKKKINKAFNKKINDQQDIINQLRKKLNENNEVDTLLKKKLFVTKIYGIGPNREAQFYFDNNITTHSAGETIVPGAKVLRIEKNGVLVSFKGKKEFISITSVAHAHSRTFDKEALEREKDLFEIEKMNMLQGPSMGKLAQKLM